MREAAHRDSARLDYQRQDSGQTLAQGLAEYYAVNRGRITRPDDLPEATAALFRSHDICHVIFGLDISLADETLADARTLLSCDVGWRRYAAYIASDPQAKAIFRELGWLRAVSAVVGALPRIARAAIEAIRTPKRWPWAPPDRFHERSLTDLRREFGIRVI